MKKLIFLIAIAFSGLTAKAQSLIRNGKFHLEPASIVWTKFSDTIPDFDALKNNPNVLWDKISFDALENNPDILGDDISEYSGVLRLFPFFAKYSIVASFSILEMGGEERGKGKKQVFRIDVTNIRVNDEQQTPIEWILLTKRSRFKKNISKQYDILFSDFFNPKKENGEIKSTPKK